MSNLELLLNRKETLLARMSRVDILLTSKRDIMVIGGGLDLNVGEPVCNSIMEVLSNHKGDCWAELKDIERKLDAINELLGEQQ
ncbi:hypothetical protein UFOVP1043_75 [uncultured Caudovirales phage]|uniref:Uncharacterized protein n=1 Tax=uncultured Caudovirales phage TaxID=2100421 RepID=A0A6J5QAS6_9CAUD|nr:hypothetical protein UFOVP1043_75 [uncultured Caudovirales phage]